MTRKKRLGEGPHKGAETKRKASLRLRVPGVVGADFPGSATDRRTAINLQAASDVVPLVFPSAHLGDVPDSVHVVLIGLPRWQLIWSDGAVADEGVGATGRNRTADVVDHRHIGPRCHRSIIPHPNVRLDATAGIGSTATALVAELGDDESGSWSREKGHRQAGTVVGLIRFRLRSQIVSRKGQRTGSHHIRHLDRSKDLLPGRSASGQCTGHRTIVCKHRRQSPVAGYRVGTTDVGRGVDRSRVPDPGTKPNEVTSVDGCLEHRKARNREIDIGNVLDLIGDTVTFSVGEKCCFWLG